MELIEGPTLEAVACSRPMPIPAALEIVDQVASALAALHQQGIVHRDIKPQNILLDAGRVAKVADFGVALDVTETNRLTQVGVGVGSLLYSSPEQLLGNADMHADMYGLGATCYFLLTSHPPFGAKLPMPELFALKFAAPPDPRVHLPQLPAPLAQFVMRLMAPHANQRYADEARLCSDLQSLRRANYTV